MPPGRGEPGSLDGDAAGGGLPLSVIIPVFNARETVASALESVLAQLGEGDEVLVVDDGSTDDSVEIVEAYPVRLIRNPTNLGTNASRNVGAHHARGRLLLFTDADARLGPGTLARARKRFEGDDPPDAVVGVYAAQGGPSDPVSTFKNLWIRHSYLRAPERLHWLFGCIFALHRSLYMQAGGFSAGFRRDTGGGDIEFGLRLHREGFRIRLDRRLEAIHLRRHTVRSLLENDLRRSAGYTALGIESVGLGGLLRRRRFANVDLTFILSVFLAWGIAALGAASLPGPALLPAWLFTLSVYLLLNTPFYRYLHRHGRSRLTAAGGALLFASHLTCLVGITWGTLGLLWKKRAGRGTGSVSMLM